MRPIELEPLVDSIPARFGVPGCSALATRAGETLFFRAAGFSDAAQTRAVSRGDLYWIYSLTKLFTAVVALRLMEEGVFGLDDPVSRYLPEWENPRAWGANGLEPCRAPRVFELMTMTGGLNYDLDAPALRRLKASGEAVTLRALSRALAAEPLDFVPGAHYRYSLCHDLLGAMMEEASGASVEALFRTLVKEPLGAPDMTFFPTSRQMERLACQHRFDAAAGACREAGPENPFILGAGFASTGAGLCAGIDDVALLADALANGGLARTGRRILREESVKALATDRLSPAQRADFAEIKPTQYGYGLGAGVLRAPEGAAPAGGFGWDGAAGSMVFIDPGRRASLVYVQHVLDHADMPRRIQYALREAFCRALEHE